MAQYYEPDLPCIYTKLICYEAIDRIYKPVPGKKLLAWVHPSCTKNNNISFLKKLKEVYGFTLLERGIDVNELDSAFNAGWNKEEIVLNTKGPKGLQDLQFAEDRLNGLINLKYGVPADGKYPSFYAVFIDEPIKDNNYDIVNRPITNNSNWITKFTVSDITDPRISNPDMWIKNCDEMRREIERQANSPAFQRNIFYISWFTHNCLKTEKGLIVGESNRTGNNRWRDIQRLNDHGENWVDSVCYNSYQDSDYWKINCDTYLSVLPTKGKDQTGEWELINNSGFSGGRAFISIRDDVTEFGNLLLWASTHNWNEIWTFPGSDDCTKNWTCNDFESLIQWFCKMASLAGFL